MRTGKIITSMLYQPTAGWDSSVLGFFKSLFEQPAILVGLFALVGCLVQRKKMSETIVSVTKVIVGFLILAIGASSLTESLHGLTRILSNTLGLESGNALLIPSNEAMMAWFTRHSSNIMMTATLILLLGMMLNILLAKFSRLKFIFLTGHVAFYLSITIAAGLDAIGIHPLENVENTIIAILGGSMLLGLYMAISPSLTVKYIKKIAPNEDVAIGHTGSLGFCVAGLIGQGIGKLSKKRNKPIISAEDVKVPEKIRFLQNSMISTIITMFTVFLIITIIGLSVKGLSVFNDPEGSLLGTSEWTGLNWGYAITYPLLTTFMFTAGVQIILMGVKMFLSELTPAFAGISSKLVKGSKPAIAIQMFWEKNPNSVIFGFLSSFTAGLLVFGITAGIHFGVDGSVPMILPQLIPHFFLGATAAIFANAFGGYKGAIAGSFVLGIIIMIFPLIFYYSGIIPSVLVSDISSVWSDPDALYAVVGVSIGRITKWAFFAIMILLFITPIIYNYTAKYFKKIIFKKPTKQNKTKK